MKVNTYLISPEFNSSDALFVNIIIIVRTKSQTRFLLVYF